MKASGRLNEHDCPNNDTKPKPNYTEVLGSAHTTSNVDERVHDSSEHKTAPN